MFHFSLIHLPVENVTRHEIKVIPAHRPDSFNQLYMEHMSDLRLSAWKY